MKEWKREGGGYIERHKAENGAEKKRKKMKDIFLQEFQDKSVAMVSEFLKHIEEYILRNGNG